MGGSVSKAIGNFFEDPIAALVPYNPFNPKKNSLGDVWDQTVGPSSPEVDFLTDAGFNKAANVYRGPSWDELGKPGQAFAERVDAQNSILPADWRPYAQSVEGALLNFLPVVGPLASAGFNTAYAGGKQQELNKGFDWGELGKTAATNFGTAAVTMGANKLLSQANQANAAKNFTASPASVSSGGNAAIADNVLGAFSPEIGATGNFAQGATAANLASNSANALGSIGLVPSTASAAGSALNSFSSPFNSSSESLVPKAQSLQSSGIGDAAYKTAVSGGKDLVNQSITQTLAPEGTQPIGVFDNFSESDTGGGTTSQWGDILNAFGGSEINQANPSGPRINDEAFNSMVDRLGANSYLQQTQARDSALPAGQFEAPLNTPYSNRLDQINKGSQQSYQDLVDQVNNANRYYGVIDSNPGLTNEQLDNFLADPSQGVLGNFRVPDDQLDYFKTLRTLGPQNMSLIQ